MNTIFSDVSGQSLSVAFPVLHNTFSPSIESSLVWLNLVTLGFELDGALNPFSAAFTHQCCLSRSSSRI